MQPAAVSGTGNRVLAVIALGDFERLSGLSRDAIVRTMGNLRPEAEDLYSLPVLALRYCGGRLPVTARLAELHAGSRLLTTRNGRAWSVLGGQPRPENDLPSPSPFD